MNGKFLTTLILGTLLAAAASAADAIGVVCRQDADQPKTLEIEKKSSGDLVVRISGYQLFGDALPAARSIEVTLPLASCQPASVGHWMDGNLFTCISSDEPKIRDANGEPMALPAAFTRVYFNTSMETYLVERRNRFHYDLQITTANGALEEADQFSTDPHHLNHCKLRDAD